jgi:hypothetical protein
MKRALGIRLAGAAGALVLLSAVWELALEANGSGDVLGRFSPEWALILMVFVLVGGAVGLLCLLASARPNWFASRAEPLVVKASRSLGMARWPLAGVLMVLPAAMVFGPSPVWLSPHGVRATLLLFCGLLAGLAFPRDGRPKARDLGLALLLSAGVFVFAREFGRGTGYPFKLGWSEGNRLWDYSLYFGLGRYQFAGDFHYPSYLAPGRHGLWGLVYLIPAAPIWLVRLWDAVLWTAPALLLGWVLVRRAPRRISSWLGAAFILWVFAFLSQGPIYAPLLLSAAWIGWGYRRERPLRTAVVVFVACLYAGLSRWTWMVAPAIWAASWGLLDSRHRHGLVGKLRYPAAYAAAGLAGGLASQWIMDLAFPQEGAVFSTAFSQDLLWYRLLPSPTNPLGLLPGLLLATLPIAGVLLLIYRQPRAGLAWTGVGGGLALFLGVGLVASVKIGGGNNLHNLDMLLVDLVLLTGYGLSDLASGDGLKAFVGSPVVSGLMVLAVVIPAWWIVGSGAALRLPSASETQEALERVRARVESAAGRGPVLFIDQRQLLTFGQITGVPLVLDYELKDLMNQAMAHNDAYLEMFERDLAAHRFELIVVDPQREQYQGRTHPFGEENDAWVRSVTIPLLKYYQPVLELNRYGLWLMAPRTQSVTRRWTGG